MNWLKKLSPSKIGLPNKYTGWRPYQAEAVWDLLQDQNRFKPGQLPTGSGKSLLGIGVALVEGGRSVYLTGSKALQDQLMKDFGECGLSLIKGRGNYQCQAMGGVYTCEEFSKDCRAKLCPELKEERECRVPVAMRHSCTPTACETWAGECPYRKAYQAAIKSKLVVTNYDYWVYVNRFAQGLGPVDMLICDEVHGLPESLCSMMSTTVNAHDLMVLDCEQPEYDNISQAWKEWAEKIVQKVALEGLDRAVKRMQGSEHGSRDAVRARSRLEKVIQKIGVLATMHGRWIVEPVKDGWQFDPVWPFMHTESWLWKGVPSIILMSATVTPKTLGLLGIGKSEYTFHSYPSVFPKRNAPVYHIKSAMVNFKMKEANRIKWLGMIAQFLKRRTDRKGIVHTVSYKRRDEIINYLAERHPDLLPYCVTHDSWSTADTIRRFKASPEPKWLLSPSVTTGYDFPYEACEFVCWTKLPFPSSQSEVMKARQKEDDQYSGYLMIQELIQGAGRGFRAADDRCEIAIFDDSWFWVKGRYAHLIPDWFTVQYRELIPPPPPRLALIREMEEGGRSTSAIPEEEVSPTPDTNPGLDADLDSDVPF